MLATQPVQLNTAIEFDPHGEEEEDDEDEGPFLPPCLALQRFLHLFLLDSR
jgi:hypothetical protein